MANDILKNLYNTHPQWQKIANSQLGAMLDEGELSPEEAQQLMFSRLNPMQQSQISEEATMTHPLKQLYSFINSLFAGPSGVPQQQIDGRAHDSIDSLYMKNAFKNKFGYSDKTGTYDKYGNLEEAPQALWPFQKNPGFGPGASTEEQDISPALLDYLLSRE